MSSNDEDNSNVNRTSETTQLAEASNSSTSSNNTIGYCHECDRQVNIDPVAFTCSVCHGGFIELFEMDRSQSGNRIRMANFGNLLPMLLPQLQGQTLLDGQQQQRPMAQNLNQHLQQHFDQLQQQLNQNEAPTTVQSQSTSGNSGPNVLQGSFGSQPSTRLQFIVPGEQFDLYGIINSVLADVLDPRRQANAQQGQNQQFHFQVPPIRMFQLHGDLRDYAWGPTGLDTIITQLLNQLENTGPPPASDDQLKNLPVVTIGQEEVDKNVQCAICMEDFGLNDKAKRLPCKHYFHEPCIVEWLRLHGTCPVCRKNLNGEDTSQHEFVRNPLNEAAAAAAAEAANNNSNNDNQTSNSSSSSSSSSSSNTNTSTNANTTNNGSTNANSGRNSSNANNNIYYDPDFD